MTDPNEYDPVLCLPKTSSRLVLVPAPSRQRTIDTTAMRSKKRYSNMPTWTVYGKASNTTEVARETPYTFRKHEQRNLFPPKQMTVSSNHSTEYGSSDPDSDIELNHFLTEADQMDSAIDNFLESTSSNGSCRSHSRPGSGTATPQRYLQLRPNVSSKDQQRHSVMSNISNIVDLQRIQDQINNAGQDQRSRYGYGYRHGACREAEGFGRISLVARPSTTWLAPMTWLKDTFRNTTLHSTTQHRTAQHFVSFLYHSLAFFWRSWTDQIGAGYSRPSHTCPSLSQSPSHFCSSLAPALQLWLVYHTPPPTRHSFSFYFDWAFPGGTIYDFMFILNVDRWLMRLFAVYVHVYEVLCMYRLAFATFCFWRVLYCPELDWLGWIPARPGRGEWNWMDRSWPTGWLLRHVDGVSGKIVYRMIVTEWWIESLLF